MREPRNTEELDALTERMMDRFREKGALELRDLAEIIMGLIAHIHRLEKVLQVVGHPDRPKSATLKVDGSAITVKPTTIDIKCDDFLLAGSHNVVLRAEGKFTTQAAGHLTVNGLRITQTGGGAIIDGGSELQLKGNKIVETGQDSISLKANRIDITAAGELKLKGSKISEN